MIRQHFDVRGYWKVIVWYDLDYDLFWYVEDDMRRMGFSRANLETPYRELRSGMVKAVTISSLKLHRSIVLFNYHSTKRDYLDSIVHEAEHVKQAILEAYNVEDRGEPPAYTIGYLIGRMYPVLRNLICEKSC